MLALDAEIHLKGPKGWRVVKAPTSSRTCSPWTWPPTRSSSSVQFAPVRTAAYAKLHQRASHFAIVGVAAALEVSGGTIRVGAHRPDRRELARHAADERGAGARRDSRCRRTTIEARRAGWPAPDLEDVNADIHASAEYRRAMIPVFTRRALDGGDGARVRPQRSHRRSFALQAREEPVEHHLRDAADQPLAEARDRAAGLHRAGDVHDRRRAVGAQRDRRAALHEPGPSLSFHDQTVRRVRHLVGQRDRAVVGAGDRREATVSVTR